MNSVYSVTEESMALLPGLGLLCADLPLRLGGDGVRLQFTPTRDKNGFSISHQGRSVSIVYKRHCDAYRALATLLAGLCPEGAQYERDCAFDLLGVMIDVSRNGVLKIDAIKVALRRLALMGINCLQLYMEDVFMLPDEPFFGYGRGAYSPEELRTIDEYGRTLGIELVPCIQTLGHLEQILQWPAYADLKDTSRVLLAEHEPTYTLLGKILDEVSSCFSTRKIHIGMDEAEGMGLGQYRKIHGDKRTFDIFSNHLKRVTRICAERGLEPMIWSDMFFRIGSAKHDYYDVNSKVPADVIGHIPKETAMVYWDYYHEEPAFYEDWIKRHREMGKEPILATGAWTWGRFWACMERAVRTNSAGMAAARKQGLKEIFITAWGDDGNECHPASTFASIQYFTELAYNETADMDSLEKLFAVAAGGSYSAYVRASEIDTIPRIKGCPLPDANFGKWVLWHDPILGFLSPQIPKELPQHYQTLAAELRALAKQDRSTALEFPALLSQVLAGKARLHLEVRACYQRRDSVAMRQLMDDALIPTLEAMTALWKLHRKVWCQWYKPFGWEVIESRYATVCARLDRLGQMIGEFLDNPAICYEEFEYELQRVYPEERYPQMYFAHRRTVTASAIY